MRSTFATALSALFLISLPGAPAVADAASGGPRVAATSGAHDDVPPFVPARGPDQPLAFAVSGLRLGFAQVGAGERIFGVCWQGGQAPYEVSLRNEDGNVLLHERGLRADEVVKASSPVALAPGAYFIELADAAGGRSEGRFQVVDTGDIPVRALGDSPQSRVGEAEALMQSGPAFGFEAYLRIVNDAVVARKSPADDLAHRLCHRV